VALEFRVEGYLTERKLADILSVLAPSGFATQFRVDGHNYRWDIKYEREREWVVVEYNGDEHYRNSLVIRADRSKARLASEHGFRTVSFPYWLQLDSFTLRHFFGFEEQIVQDFPHGFITTKLFPASFCELGIQRFREEIFCLPLRLREPVLQSLRDRGEEYGIEYVLPSALRGILQDGGNDAQPRAAERKH
jgi:hypothetical protein